jgi:hypothetical protein
MPGIGECKSLRVFEHFRKGDKQSSDRPYSSDNFHDGIALGP